ncbi:MAG: ATP-binding protein, partial [Candidatus Omnitrophica bacterium]|nr:ATP-binding protein [Candidatus Omnitrophota bacterium]
MKIAAKISLSFLIIVMLFTVISASFFYGIAKKGLEKTIYAELKSTAMSRAEHIETYLEMLKLAVNQLSKSVVLENFLKTADDPAAFAIAMTRLKRTQEADPAIYEFLLLDEAGKVIASSNKKSVGSDKSTDALFLGSQKGTYIKDAYLSDILNEPLIAVSAPFLDSTSGRLLGVLAARVRLSDLYKITTETTGLGATGEIYIVNRYSFMITPSRSLKDTFLKQKVDTPNVSDCLLHRTGKMMDQDNEPVIVCRDYLGTPVLGTHIYLPEMQWCILAEISIQEAMAPLKKIRILFTVVVCLIPLATWLVGLFFGHMISEPIYKLHRGAEIIGAGNLDYKVGTGANDEIGQLSRAFDAMTENLQYSTASIERLNREITERKKLEEKLATIAQEWETTFNSINDLVSIQSAKDNSLMKVNKAYAEFFKMKPEDIIGMKCHKIVHETDAPCLGCPHQETIKTRQSSRLEYFEERFGLFLEVSTYPIFDNHHEVIATVHIVKDITQRKKAEAAAKEAVEVKSRFTSMVSHELRTPLTAIKESISLVLDGTTGALNDEQKDFLEMSKRNVDRLARLINDVLEYQKLESGKLVFTIEEHDINEVIKEVQDMMLSAAKPKGLAIILDLDGTLPNVKFDRDKMIQVLTNLVNNALKFTDKGSITLISRKMGNVVRLTVKDTGPGIRNEDIPKLFTAFEQLEKGKDRKTGGTGLGLAISKENVDK